ncbi:MAG: GAF domain-containing protein [Ignavibacteria bacterium]|nr:GAF domain-containing protein [Ignavibacteria bacterium]
MAKKSERTKINVRSAETVKSDMQGRKVKSSGVLERLRALHEIAGQMDLAQSREDILGVVRSEAKWLLNYEVCFAGFLNRAHSHYIITTLSSVADASDLNHKHVSVDEGMPGWVVKNRVAIIEDIGSGPAFSHAVEGKIQELGIKSLLIVPMRTGNELLGSLTFGATKSGSYSDEDAEVAQLLSLYVATALKNASVFENARKRITQIELINEISSQLTSMLQLDELLKAAAAAIHKNFNYFDVTVFLLSEDRSELVVEAHAGSFVDFLPHGFRLKVGEGLVGWAAQYGEKILCNDVSQDPRYRAYEYHNTKSELTIPIKIDSDVVGILNVEDTKLHAFDETDAVVLETLSGQLGTAIRNAKLYDEVRKANMKLTELDKMKSEFLGIVSHDFRSPLSSIILAGKALLKNEVVQGVQRIREYLQIMVDQANRLNQLAEDTLSITKIESGRLRYYFKVVNLERLIQDAISMVRFSSRHQIEYTIDPNLVFIKGDQTKLRQVVQNLISNAVKYSPRGGKVTVTVEDDPPEKILVCVCDEGIGIPPEQVDKLFQKFSRVETGEAKDIRGAGLGLWICREVVEAHGGKIWIESEVGKGSTMKFTLNKAQ